MLLSLLLLLLPSASLAARYAVLSISAPSITNATTTDTQAFENAALFSTFGTVVAVTGTPVYRFVPIQRAFQLIDGCLPFTPTSAPGPGPWIAIIARGNCMFYTKAYNAAVAGASALVVVDNVVSTTPILMYATTTTPSQAAAIPSVSLTYTAASQLVTFMEKHVNSTLSIALGASVSDSSLDQTNDVNYVFMNNLVVGVIVIAGISMCVMMAFYVRTRRMAQVLRMQNGIHTEAQQRAVREALDRLPTRVFHRADVEDPDDLPVCAVCLEEHDDDDVLRVLPCKHEMHKVCLDPWLAERATCPLCKRSILDADADEREVAAIRESSVDVTPGAAAAAAATEHPAAAPHVASSDTAMLHGAVDGDGSGHGYHSSGESAASEQGGAQGEAPVPALAAAPTLGAAVVVEIPDSGMAANPLPAPSTASTPRQSVGSETGA